MARQLKRLTTRTVATLTKIGRHADGGNLYLTISKTDSGLSKRWTFMFALAGKQREAGFGSASIVTLAEAREKAAEYRSMLAKGLDPLDAKKAARDAEAARKTFGQCADELIKSKRREWRSEKHAGQWRKTVAEYCGPIWEESVDAIDTQAILSILKPIWETIPETASRLRGRIEAVLDYGKAHGLRSGENPAAWRGHLALILPRRQKLTKGHHAAMPYREVPAFIAKLREHESIQSLALEFTILMGPRSGEALGAQWAEFDLDAKIWKRAPNRMKAGLEHRTPLPARALEILAKMAEIRCGDFIFPGQRRGQPLGHSSLRRLCGSLCQRHCFSAATPHGFRSSFRDWAGDETNFPRELAELALAHATGDATERAYRRGDALEKRRALMDAWAAYVELRAGGNVVPMRAAQ
jgi:integrase